MAISSQFCRYAAQRRCTGCSHLQEPYARQLAWKADLVRDQVAAVPGAAAVVRPTVPSPLPMAYRASVKLCLHQDREGRRSVGLYRMGGKEVVHVPDCPAQTRAVTNLVGRLFSRELRPPAAFYDHRGRSFQRGRLKFLVARGGDGLILSHTGVPREALIRWLKAAGLQGVSAYESKLTQRDGDLPIGYHVEHLSGPERFPFKVGGRTFELSPAAFFQANASLSDSLVAAATAFTDDGDVLLDLYGGFGAYSFAVLGRFRRLYVVDGNQAAIAAAQRAARAGDASHLTATAVYCETFLEDRLPADERARVTHVLVNPPRAGLSRRVLSALTPAKLPGLRELHYVSCNPATLARDLGVLAGAGLTVASLKPYDMFPQTDHIEVVATLRRSTGR